VNFASRLEGMNKIVGTNVLISESIQQKIAGRFVTRPIGHFAVVGKKQGMAVHELICPIEKKTEEHKWVPIFEEALTFIRTGDFTEAKKKLRETVWQRGGSDGPSEFYITKIAQMEKEGTLEEWTGVVKLSDK
jgi:adenylate cyclase